MSIQQKIKQLLGKLPSRVKIASRYIGSGEPTFIIAEAGINHNGSIELAKQLIDAAARAGADAVKFQKRTTVDILTREGREKSYNSPNAFAPTYGEHRDALELSEESYYELKKYSEEKNILFFASVWDKKSGDFLERLGIDAYKIPSADVTNLELLSHIAKKNKPVLISTGMSTEEEIEAAIDAILPHNTRIVLFHCVSLYPCTHDKLHIRYMNTLEADYRPLPVGYSGHESDLLPTLVAVSRGASIVERHLTLDKSMKGSDHAASLNPEEFTELVNSIRDIEITLGQNKKVMHPELIPLREKLAKSVATNVRIEKGARITADMLAIKGPGTGISPAKLMQMVGKIAQEDIDADCLLPVNALDWPTR